MARFFRSRSRANDTHKIARYDCPRSPRTKHAQFRLPIAFLYIPNTEYIYIYSSPASFESSCRQARLLSGSQATAGHSRLMLKCSFVGGPNSPGATIPMECTRCISATLRGRTCVHAPQCAVQVGIGIGIHRGRCCCRYCCESPEKLRSPIRHGKSVSHIFAYFNERIASTVKPL